jgi:hypothetical protein
MADEFGPRPIAAWYMIGAVVSLLLMILFCVLFVMHLTADPAAMPLDQRAAYEATPGWVIGAFGLGALAGLAGGILLLLKRRQAEWLMLAALIGVLAWLAGSLAVGPLREAMSANDLLMIIVMAAITWTIFWFARHSRMRGWLS